MFRESGVVHSFKVVDPILFVLIIIIIIIRKSDPVTGPVWPRGWVEV